MACLFRALNLPAAVGPPGNGAMSAVAPTPVDQVAVTQGAWAAKGAWGSKAKQSTDSPPKLQEGQEECNICFESAVDVRFVPCKHGSCNSCVDQLRIAAVFKPDAGVRCPYCRQYVNGFSSLTGEVTGFNLQQANKAARAASAAREASAQQKLHEVKQPAASTSQDGPPQVWNCVDCGKINYGFSPKCHRCKKAAPRQSQPVSKDVLQCNSEELVFMACRKFHPDFNQAFKEAGVPYVMEDARATGTHEGVVAALLNGGQKRLIHIISVIIANGKLWHLITNLIGNYFIQDLLLALKMIREAAKDPAILKKASVNVAAATGVVRGKDAFAQVQGPILERAAELLKHPQGFFVLDKAVGLSTGPELLSFARLIFTEHSGILLDKWFLRLVSKIVDRLVDTSCGTEGDPRERAEAGDLLETFCGHCCARESQVVNAAGFWQPGQMLVEAIQGSLPRNKAITLASIIAGYAQKLAGNKKAVATLQSLMALRSFEESSADNIITVICCVAQSLETAICEVAARVDQDGHRLVQTLVEQLAAVKENAWVYSIATELVQGVAKLLKKPQVMSVVAFTLAQQCYEAEQLDDLLQTLDDQAGTSSMLSLLAQVNEIRASQHPDLASIPPPQSALATIKAANAVITGQADAAWSDADLSSYFGAPQQNPPVAPHARGQPLQAAHTAAAMAPRGPPRPGTSSTSFTAPRRSGSLSQWLSNSV
ncbi:hypothetical protein WJX73_006383 [Symbiochloris irregularis]|uniref:RING-type domain-containing protein n=1 Tax=Symbiochloris irregularis TaxID=706552 RepID=A0AAW1P969_9CHLO